MAAVGTVVILFALAVRHLHRVLHATFRFDSVVRVCIKMEAPLDVSDGLYVWIRDRENSYAIPLEAAGGAALLEELIRRGTIPAELATKAMSATHGLFCHPPSD